MYVSAGREMRPHACGCSLPTYALGRADAENLRLQKTDSRSQFETELRTPKRDLESHLKQDIPAKSIGSIQQVQGYFRREPHDPLRMFAHVLPRLDLGISP